MNVDCPQCKTVFRIDPRKVGASGVRARCSICGGVFEVSPNGEREMATASAARAPEEARATGSGSERPEGGSSGRSASSAAPAVGGAPPADSPGAAEEDRTGGGQEVRPEPAVGAPEPAPRQEPAAEAPAFGRTDPESRSRRLARALISDMVAYHPERQEVGLREGRLKELFRDEIKKAWREYVDQVGLESAKEKPHFRDALNEILARGKQVF